MRKELTVIILITSCLAIVSVQSDSVREERDVGKQSVFASTTVISNDLVTVKDLVMINDAVVPVVQSHYLCHQELVDPVLPGFVPAKEAKARAPTVAFL